MVSRTTSLKVRKIHRYLGLCIGIQFLMWTISGLYFSWTDLDEIHGDHFKKIPDTSLAFDSLISPTSLALQYPVKSIGLRDIQTAPYYVINDTVLYHAQTGIKKEEITEEEALYIVRNYTLDSLKIAGIEKILEVDKHHEYREKLLPAYVISFDTSDQLKAYVSSKDGTFQTVRHRSWRWFDFLWMTHTMDYEGRDDFNNLLLRAFSFFGLLTVCSGFLLWAVSSPSLRKLRKRRKT